MPKVRLAVVAALLITGVPLAAAPIVASAADSMGTVTSANRVQLNAFDANGNPLGPVKAADLKLPQPIVAMGKGNSIGVRQGARTVFLRGLDVNTSGMHTGCKPVEVASRAKGSSYAASNMGLGGAADCSK